MDARKASFQFSVEVSIEIEALTGKWSAKSRYGQDAVTAWIGAGTQYNSADQAAEVVLAKVRALFPDLTGEWFSQAQAQLTTGGVQ